MPTVVQFRRGTTAQNDAFTGAVGELSIDTQKDTLRVHDGSTAGGFELLQRNLTNQTIGGNIVPDTDSAYDLGSPTNKWRSLYLSGNTLYIGNLVLKDNNGTLSIEDSAGTALAGSFSTLETTGNVTVGGNLTVNGTTTTLNTSILEVEDKNITLAKGAADSASADGAGITVEGANAYIIYDHAAGTWDLNRPLNSGFNVLQNYTTTEIAEGTNLYYTTARVNTDFDTRLATKTTTNLTEGDNLYYTTARFDTRLATKTTSDLTEGSNLYYTTARADSDAKAAITGGTGITYLAGTIETNDAQIVHDNLSGFVANEHIDHSTVTLTAGNGLTGGGDLTASRTFNIGEGTGITVGADAISTNDAEIVHDNLSGFVANEHIDHTTVSVTAGAGLTGGGTIAATRTLNIGQGTGITVSADAISTNDAQIVHDNLSGFVGDEHVAHSGVTFTAGVGLNGGGNIAASRTFNIDSAELYANFAHDDFHDYVADEHVAHSGVTITAGAGLTGGGTIAASRTLNIGQGTGITVSADAISTNDAQIVHDNLSGFVADEHVAHTSVTITAGAGLTGGGDISASRTLNVGAGTGITVSADAISTNDAQIVHDNLSGFVADEHIAHSSVTMTAGNGLTGGGTIAASRTFNVGAGTGVTVSADAVSIGQDVATTADVTFGSVTTTGNIVIGGNLQVTGTTTTVNSESLQVTDNMIYMNAGESDGSPTQSIDVGWAANVNDGGSYTHVGMFRDATDDRFKVFGAYTPEPDAALEINTGHASFALADFQAATFYGALSGNVTGNVTGNLTGNVTGNASTATALQTARTIGGVSFNGTANINLPGVNIAGNQNTSGNAATATKLATARTIALTGDVTATGVAFDGTGNISLTTAMAANSVDLGTHTTGNYVAAGATSGNGISGSVSSEGGTFTVTSNATNANTGSTIVFRDASGNFSAGTITAALSGNASTATKLATARNIALTGDVTGSANFDGSGNISITATVGDDTHNHTIANVDGLQTALNGKYSTSGGTISGNVTVDAGTNTTLTVVSDDTGASGVRAYGASQGTGYLEVGQSSTYGGGISYNGDGSPAFVSGETADRVTFYRLDNGTRTEVFSYGYNSNDVQFNGTISATAGSTLVIYNSAGTALKTIKGIS